MSDYEHRDLENKIDRLERQLDDLRYEVNRLGEDKADKDHHHRQYQTKESY